MQLAFQVLLLLLRRVPPGIEVGAQVLLNGHEHVAVAAQAAGIGFTKEGNC